MKLAFVNMYQVDFQVDNLFYRPVNLVFGSIFLFIGLQISFSGRYFYLSACKSHFRVDIFIYRPANSVFGSIFVFIGLQISFSGRYLFLSVHISHFWTGNSHESVQKPPLLPSPSSISPLFSILYSITV